VMPAVHVRVLAGIQLAEPGDERLTADEVRCQLGLGETGHG
jgi:hypothetical protein